MTRICSWCGKDMSEKYPEQPGVTHGICEKRKAKIMAEKDGPDGGGICSSFDRPRPFSEEVCPYCGTRHVYGECQYVR